MRLRTVSIIGAVALALCVEGCSSSKASVAPAGRGGSSPSRVAVEFITALYGGKPGEAVGFVPPSDRAFFRDITEKVTPRSVEAIDISAARTVVHGATAQVTLAGTLCTISTKQSSRQRQCLTNRRPQTSDPVFTIPLLRSDGTWYVYYPGSHSTQSSSGFGSSGP